MFARKILSRIFLSDLISYLLVQFFINVWHHTLNGLLKKSSIKLLVLLSKSSLSCCVLIWAMVWGVLIFSRKHYQCHHFLWLPWKNEIILTCTECNTDNISPRKTKYSPTQGANIINVDLSPGQTLFCYIKKKTKNQERIGNRSP